MGYTMDDLFLEPQYSRAIRHVTMAIKLMAANPDFPKTTEGAAPTPTVVLPIVFGEFVTCALMGRRPQIMDVLYDARGAQPEDMPVWERISDPRQVYEMSGGNELMMQMAQAPDNYRLIRRQHTLKLAGFYQDPTMPWLLIRLFTTDKLVQLVDVAMMGDFGITQIAIAEDQLYPMPTFEQALERQCVSVSVIDHPKAEKRAEVYWRAKKLADKLGDGFTFGISGPALTTG